MVLLGLDVAGSEVGDDLLVPLHHAPQRHQRLRLLDSRVHDDLLTDVKVADCLPSFLLPHELVVLLVRLHERNAWRLARYGMLDARRLPTSCTYSSQGGVPWLVERIVSFVDGNVFFFSVLLWLARAE